MRLIVEEARRRGLTVKETAFTLAVARTESGFNPDAASGAIPPPALAKSSMIPQRGSAFGMSFPRVTIFRPPYRSSRTRFGGRELT